MRALALAALYLAGIAAAGCSELPAFDKPCGNGVIDPGEDCDNNDPSCDDQCRLHCSDDTSCEDAGTAYRCGQDGICHAPSGVFNRNPGTTFPYAVGQGEIADLDGDGIGDVVGFSDVNIDVRFGDPAAEMTTRATAIVPFANTNISLRPLPASLAPPNSSVFRDSTDILLPTADGIAGFTARNKSVVSYPFTNNAGQRGACAMRSGMALPRESFSIDKHHLAFVTRYNASGELAIVVMDPADPLNCVHVDLPGLVVPLDAKTLESPIAFDHYEVPGGTTNVTSMIAVVGPPDFDPTTPGATAYVVRFDDNGGVFTLDTTPPLKLSVGEGPVAFARTQSGQPCPSLFARTEASGIVFFGQTGAPCFVSSTPSVPFGDARQFPAGHLPTSPTGMQTDVLGVVTELGFGGTTTFYALQPSGAGIAVYDSPRPLYPIRNADLDGDGTVEGIGIVGTYFSGSNPDIEILYRTNTTNVGFIAYRVPTQATPTFLELGDFDGNSLPDIAYTEKLGDHDRLMVSYSTRDRVLEPAEIATFTNVEAMSRIDIPDSLDPSGQVLDDLLIIDVLTGTEEDPTDTQSLTPLLAILHGNPQRSMLAYYDPRRGYVLNPALPSKIVAAIPGQFVPGTKPGVMSLEHVRNPNTQPGDPEPVKLWIAQGSKLSNGFIEPEANEKTTTRIGIDRCGPSAVTPLCLNGSQIRTWHLPASNRDIVLIADAPVFPGVSHTRQIVTIDPMAAEPVRANPIELPSFQPATKMWPVDLDGTNKMRLVISLPLLRFFNPFISPEDTDKVLVCDVDDVGNVTACPLLTDLVEDLAGYNCSSAEIGRIGPGSRFEGGVLGTQGVIALCAPSAGGVKSIFRVYPRDGKLVADSLIEGVAYEFLSVGDLNGDYADDIVGIGFDASRQPVVSIHTQCEAHDVACIQSNVEVPILAPPP